MRGSVGALTVAWLATDFDREQSQVRVGFSGSRLFDCTPAAFANGQQDAVQADALWRFATLTRDGLRREAVEGALVEEVRYAAKFDIDMKAVENRARRLLHLAEQGRMSEALRTLRSSRQAALDTARAVAAATHGAARSAEDRVFVQLLATTGVVTAYLADAIDPPVAVGLVLAVLVLTAGIYYVAFHSEYPRAEAIHEGFDDDLGEVADTLPDEDIEAIRKLPSLVKAKEQIPKSKRTVKRVLWVPVLVCIIAIVVVVVTAI
jgi:hypothetical protein